MLKLQALRISFFSEKFTTTCRSLEIGGAHSFPSEVLIKFLQEHADLEEFRASPAPMLDEDIITAIGSMENLRHLALGHSFNTELRFDQLSNLTKLDTLQLNVSAILKYCFLFTSLKCHYTIQLDISIS